MQQKQMDRNIVEMLDALEKEPERIADFLEFGSRFYRYSLKNNLLIYQKIRKQFTVKVFLLGMMQGIK